MRHAIPWLLFAAALLSLAALAVSEGLPWLAVLAGVGSGGALATAVWLPLVRQLSDMVLAQWDQIDDALRLARGRRDVGGAA